MGGNVWDNDMQCTGAGFPISLPAGQAGDANRMCVKAVGCSSTDSADCQCTLHCGCAMGSASGAKSCIQRPVINPSQACDQAVCTAASANSASHVGVGIASIMGLI